MTIGSRLILETLTDAQIQLSSYQDQLESGHDETDPLTKLNDLTDAQTAYQDYLTVLKKAYILNVIDPNGAYSDFKDQLDSLEDSEVEEGYTFLVNGGCDPGFTLDCLTLLFENSENAITPIVNVALKERIIAEVHDMVGFAYNGRDAANVALPVKANNQEKPWDDEDVTARDLFEGVPFKYDRLAAADKATKMAEGTDHSLDLFAESGTDSARFMSLALHAGGLPMTVKPGEDDCDTSTVEMPTQAWCAKEVDPLLEGNRTWLVHNSETDNEENPISDLEDDERLVGYLLGNPNVLGDGISFQTSGFYDVVSVEEVLGTPAELRTDAPTTITSFSNNTFLPTTSPPVYDVYGNTGFRDRVQQVMSTLGAFEVGDYVFTGGAHQHGFMIVDVMPMIRCDDSTQLSSQEVFWVADLPGEQVGKPRPFYCSRLVEIDPNTGQPTEDDNGRVKFFAARFWYFIKVPDLVWVAYDRLYKHDPF